MVFWKLPLNNITLTTSNFSIPDTMKNTQNRQSKFVDIKKTTLHHHSENQMRMSTFQAKNQEMSLIFKREMGNCFLHAKHSAKQEN